MPRGRVIHVENVRVTESGPSKNQGKGIQNVKELGKQFRVPFLVPVEASGFLF